MKRDDFKDHVYAFVEKQLNLLFAKNGGYNDDADALRNFKAAAIMNHQTPEQALWGMASKHFISLSDMIASGQEFPAEVWDEKAGDALNFLLLLRALVDDDSDLAVMASGGPVINLTQTFSTDEVSEATRAAINIENKV